MGSKTLKINVLFYKPAFLGRQACRIKRLVSTLYAPQPSAEYLSIG